ncbi:hypothetical protein IFM89_027588 [Coptis chinensis]|uniref:Glycosyltransferase n=1 Tax=Coptis chinensis TaxID=261450 RepID=A0A835IQW0_9MAGN|nr:hypothetical protein IFM89_027588 [Coptis chinensis]
MARRGGETVVIFPFMAQGHQNPFLALARLIEQRKVYTIIFVSTPLNIQKLKSSIPSDTSITFAELQFCSTDYGLPPDTENTDTLTLELIARLLEASESLQAPFKQLLLDITKQDGRAPLCIIADMFFGWTVDVANELGIFHSVFIAGSGYGMSFYFSLTFNMSQFRNDAEEFILTDFPEAPPVHRSQVSNDFLGTDGTEPWCLFRLRQFYLCLQSDCILLNTIEGLEKSRIAYFRSKTGGRPVWSIGPACTSVLEKNEDYKSEGTRKLMNVSSNNYLEWLNRHPPGSVLYVCFGSQGSILPSQMMELAMGLEASNKAFIWVVRPPFGFSVTDKIRREWLPEGFEDRIRDKGQGLLVYRWAQQLEILSHASTGAFMSHCGWNSVLESLSYGVPIIGWPLFGDQFFNSQMLEKEAGVCVEIARGINSNIIGYKRIAEAISTVMGKTEKGEEIRRKACEVQEMMQEAITDCNGFKGSSVKALDEFFNSAISTRNSKSSAMKRM